MTDDARGNDVIQLSDVPKLFANLLSDLMSNRHRGYAGLRPGGGVHPVPGIGTERGGGLPRFDTQFTEADVIRALVDSSLAEHVLDVKADGPFSGYVLPSHVFQTSRHTFPALVAGQAPEAVRIINAHPMRLDTLIKCFTLTNGNVYLGGGPNLDSTNGYPLTQGEVVTVPTRSDVWAISDSTAQASVAMITTLREG